MTQEDDVAMEPPLFRKQTAPAGVGIVTSVFRQQGEIMTSEEIRIELKLEPWEVFRNRPERKEHLERLRLMLPPVRFTKELNRMTGRTTRMLCSALAAMSKGLRVKVYASNRIHSDSIEDILKTLATRLDIPILMARDIPEVEFFDHTYYEFMEGRM